MDFQQFREEIRSGKRRAVYLFDRLGSAESDAGLKLLEENIPQTASLVAREKFTAPEGIAEALVSLRSMPMWGEHKLVILEDIESLAPKNQQRPLAELTAYLDQPSDWACLILMTKGSPPKPLKDLLGKSVEIVEPPKISSDNLQAWIRNTLAQGGLEMEPQAMRLLMQTCQEDWSAIEREIEKILAAFPSGTRIGPTQLEFLVSHQTEQSIFEILRFLADGNTSAVLEYLNQIQRLSRQPREQLIPLWNRFYRQIRDWVAMKAITEQKSGLEGMKTLGLNPKAKWILEKQSATMSKSMLRSTLQTLERVDRQLKSSYTASPNILLETYVIGMARARSSRR